MKDWYDWLDERMDVGCGRVMDLFYFQHAPAKNQEHIDRLPVGSSKSQSEKPEGIL